MHMTYVQHVGGAHGVSRRQKFLFYHVIGSNILSSSCLSSTWQQWCDVRDTFFFSFFSFFPQNLCWSCKNFIVVPLFIKISTSIIIFKIFNFST